jgi:hypothetical protein
MTTVLVHNLKFLNELNSNWSTNARLFSDSIFFPSFNCNFLLM